MHQIWRKFHKFSYFFNRMESNCRKEEVSRAKNSLTVEETLQGKAVKSGKKPLSTTSKKSEKKSEEQGVTVSKLQNSHQ